MAASKEAYDEMMKPIPKKSLEQRISYFDKYGDVKTFYYTPESFYYTPESSVFDPVYVNEPMVLTGTDGVTLLFLVRCKFFTPGLTDTPAQALKELQHITSQPAHLGFYDYIDYKMHFEDHTSENRIIKANSIVASWVVQNIPCGRNKRGRNKDNMPLEFRRIFKHKANTGYFDIVPEDTMAYLKPADGETVELPGFIDPQEDADDSQWFYPQAGHYRQLKDGWRLRFPKISTHKIFKWSNNFQKLIDDQDAEEIENDTSQYESMKKTTEAAIDLFKKEATVANFICNR